MPLEQFAQVITGCSVMNVPAEFPDREYITRIGKKHEHKTEYIPLSWENFAEKYREAVKPFEVDGWIADKEYEHNHHRQSKKGYSVTFRRWV